MRKVSANERRRYICNAEILLRSVFSSRYKMDCKFNCEFENLKNADFIYDLLRWGFFYLYHLFWYTTREQGGFKPSNIG